MIMDYINKEFGLIMMGDAVPQTPWGLTHSGMPDGQREKAEQIALPIRIFTCLSARVAPQRCPIL